MLNGNFVKIEEIIEGVYRDLGMDEQLPWEDTLYWSWEALELIGCRDQYIRKVTGYKEHPDLDITNYKAKLPCDIHRIERIAVNGFPARFTGNSFHHLLGGDCCGVDTTTSSSQDIFIDNFGNSFSPQASTLVGREVYEDITYDLNNEYITLSVQTGKVCIAYLAIPTDDRGFPMIPDDTKYKLAIKKYLMMKLLYREWLKDSSKAQLYNHAEREWEWYVGSARGSALMPSMERMSSLKNQIIRLLPNINQEDSFFKSLGTQERKFIH